MLAVGMNGADREQLRHLVTNEDLRNVYYVRDASSLLEVEEELASALCGTSTTEEVRQRVLLMNQGKWTTVLFSKYLKGSSTGNK